MASKSDELTFGNGDADPEVMVTDAFLEEAARQPDEFHATVDTLTPHLIEHDDGVTTIIAPDEMTEAVDQNSYAASPVTEPSALDALAAPCRRLGNAVRASEIWGQRTYYE